MSDHKTVAQMENSWSCMMNFWNSYVPALLRFINMTKNCKIARKKIMCVRNGGGSWNDHLVSRGFGQMTMFDHEGWRGVKISKNLITWYMDAPIR